MSGRCEEGGWGAGGSQGSFQVSVFVSSGSVPSSRIAGSAGSSVFKFSRKLCTIFTVVASVYTPTNGAQGFLFSTSPQRFCLVFPAAAVLAGEGDVSLRFGLGFP